MALGKARPAEVYASSLPIGKAFPGGGGPSAGQRVREQPNYKSVELPPELLVGAEYGLTVSRNVAPGAADFAMYLLSPQGHASLKAFGFIPVALPVAK
jgi:ABC-type glycerol-3-phosphate transport system substrate-binding protein